MGPFPQTGFTAQALIDKHAHIKAKCFTFSFLRSSIAKKSCKQVPLS